MALFFVYLASQVCLKVFSSVISEHLRESRSLSSVMIVFDWFACKNPLRVDQGDA